MEQQTRPPNGPVKLTPYKAKARISLGPRGFIFFLLAMIVLVIGFVGYLEYEQIVEPYIKEYLCCLPAFILAIILIFLGFTSQITTVRRVQVQEPGKQAPAQSPRPKSPEPGSTDPGVSKSAGSNVFKDVEVQQTTSKSQDGLRKFEPDGIGKDELLAQKKNIQQFLNNLDDQHKDKLIMDGVYLGLKKKYKTELININTKIKSLETKKLKKMNNNK
jgi:hypothetical protein